ncbi:hypothetical protein C8J57DRAFT_1723005 [Mycena rebaudengoi]|nr:hypothetical protein C8J57DRAFT_1195520 [Mycena rebaudengoi]KAJ7251977.1 hypothetical protein C8J57DRAFT_1723005 [Mycena rebaudengoi]
MQSLDSSSPSSRFHQRSATDSWWNFGRSPVVSSPPSGNSVHNLSLERSSISRSRSRHALEEPIFPQYHPQPHSDHHNILHPFSTLYPPECCSGGVNEGFTFHSGTLYDHPSQTRNSWDAPHANISRPLAPATMEPFPSYRWDETGFSSFEASSTSSPSSPYTLRSPLLVENIFPCPSPSSSGTSSGRLSPLSILGSTSPTLRLSSLDTPSDSKECSHCHTISTPLWRRDPTTHLALCNACGLYLQQRNKMRPAVLIAVDRDAEDETEADYAPDAPQCSHCHTHRTSVWRRSKSGARLCNACGVYARLRGRDRPLTLKRNRIRPRCKHPKTV